MKMYSIGQFSIMFQMNKKTLRYYDEIGLFKPAFINENNQYRYYGEEQISIMKEIIRLKNIGISLDEIKEIINSKKNIQIKECYNRRLEEIKKEKEILEKQIQLIEKYNQEKQNKDDNCFLIIEKGYFIQDGIVYYMNVDCEMDEINDYIGLFYERAKGVLLQGTHIFKMNVDKDSKSIVEIFAYASEAKNESVRKQEKEMCLKVDCKEMKERFEGYRILFEYINKNDYEVKNIYEKYHMLEGRMQVTIIASIRDNDNIVN